VTNTTGSVFSIRMFRKKRVGFFKEVVIAFAIDGRFEVIANKEVTLARITKTAIIGIFIDGFADGAKFVDISRVRLCGISAQGGFANKIQIDVDFFGLIVDGESDDGGIAFLDLVFKAA
jgi:hypothetical protein